MVAAGFSLRLFAQLESCGYLVYTLARQNIPSAGLTYHFKRALFSRRDIDNLP